MFRSYSFFEDSEEEFGVCDNNMRVMVTTFGTSASGGTFLKAKVDKILLKKTKLQHTLNVWRNRYSKHNPSYKRIVLPNNGILHPKSRDTIEKIRCPYTSLGKCFVIVCCFILNQLLIITFSITQLITGTYIQVILPQ